MAYKEPVISDDVVLEPKLPRPSICIEAVAVTETWLRGQAMRETRFSAVWSREVRSRSNWRQAR